MNIKMSHSNNQYTVCLKANLDNEHQILSRAIQIGIVSAVILDTLVSHQLVIIDFRITVTS